MRKISNFKYLALLFIAILFSSSTLFAQSGGLEARSGNSAFEAREKARLNRAAAHYQRSRAHLLSAIDEFNKASKLANPKMIMDVNAWRGAVSKSAQDLARILAPQPRHSVSGVKLESAPNLIKKGK